MPSYAYDCGRCGPFEEFRSMARFADPCDCPDCGEPAPRLLAMASVGTGNAPRSTSGILAPRTHRAGCGCCTPATRSGLKAEAATLGARKSAPKAAPIGTFLDRS